MRRVGWLLLMLPVFVGCESSAGGSSVKCVGPYLDDQPPGRAHAAPAPTVSPGDTLVIHGHRYTSTCNDTGGDESPDPLVPLAPVRLTVTLPGGAVLRTGPFAPGGQDMGFAASVRIPARTPAGMALVRDEQRHTYRFAVGSS